MTPTYSRLAAQYVANGRTQVGRVDSLTSDAIPRRARTSPSQDLFRSTPRSAPVIQMLVSKHTSPPDVQGVEEVYLPFTEILQNVTTLRIDALLITTSVLPVEDPAHFVEFDRSFTNLGKLDGVRVR